MHIERLLRREFREKEINYLREIKVVLCEFWGNKCINCSEVNNLRLDLIKPISYNPINTFNPFNMQILCEECREKKIKDNHSGWDLREETEVLQLRNYLKTKTKKNLYNKIPFWTKNKLMESLDEQNKQ